MNAKSSAPDFIDLEGPITDLVRRLTAVNSVLSDIFECRKNDEDASHVEEFDVLYAYAEEAKREAVQIRDDYYSMFDRVLTQQKIAKSIA